MDGIWNEMKTPDDSDDDDAGEDGDEDFDGMSH